MTPKESRKKFVETQFIREDLELLKERGLYRDYVEGRISINTIYLEMKDQGI